ncbi:hypothetical protein [Streptomyces sirii]|uniref:hypothetical protein n=1 Tax=Streptomyces sirii TaxID=3127701 RepID=UPI003D367310
MPARRHPPRHRRPAAVPPRPPPRTRRAPAPGDGRAPDVWLCPHHLVERAQEALEELDDAFDEDE